MQSRFTYSKSLSDKMSLAAFKQRNDYLILISVIRRTGRQATQTQLKGAHSMWQTKVSWAAVEQRRYL